MIIFATCDTLPYSIEVAEVNPALLLALDITFKNDLLVILFKAKRPDPLLRVLNFVPILPELSRGSARLLDGDERDVGSWTLIPFSLASPGTTLSHPASGVPGTCPFSVDMVMILYYFSAFKLLFILIF